MLSEILGGCSLACQECPLLVYKSVVDGESELSFSQFSVDDALYSLSCLSTQTLFSILLSSEIRLRALASDRAVERKDWDFFQAVHNRAVALSTPGLWVGGMGAAMGGQWWEQTDTGHCKPNCWLAFRWRDCCCYSHWGQFAVAALISDVHQTADTNLLCPGSHLNLSCLLLSSAVDRKGDSAHLPVRSRRAVLLNWKCSLRRRKT